MLDIDGRSSPASHRPFIQNAEFFRIELSPLADGHIFVSLTATTVDNEEAELLDQEITSQRVDSIDAALALVRTHLHIAPPPMTLA